MTSGSTKSHIGKEDIQIQSNTGLAETFERLTTTGGKINVTKFPDIWDGTGKINVAEVAATTLNSIHKTTHQDGGADEISVIGLSGLLADSQTPLAHKVSHQDGGADEISLTGLMGDPYLIGPWVDARAYTTLELANTAAYDAGKALLIAQNYTLTANTTLTASVMRIPGGSFTKASTYTLAITGKFVNPDNGHAFIGFSAGDVTFGAGSVKEVYPQWWGENAIASNYAYSSISALNEPITVFDKSFYPLDHDLCNTKFPSLLRNKPAAVSFKNAKHWIYGNGESGAVYVISDGYYIYVALTSPSRIVKINPDTMTTVDSWTGAIGEDLPYELIIDGFYLYVSLRTDAGTLPGKVAKIDPNTMETVAVWTGSAGQVHTKGLCSDGSYIYVSCYVDPAVVVKIDPVTMTTVATWTGDTANYQNQDWPQVLVYDGTYLYVGCDGVPGMTVRLDPATMTMVGTILAYCKQGNSRLIMYTGNYTKGGQRINIAAGTVISRVDFLLDKVGSPTGTATVVARRASDDTLLGTFGTINVSTVTTSPIWYHFLTPVTFTETEDVRILIEYSGGDDSNYLGLRMDSNDRTTGQNTYYSVAGGWVDSTGDASIKLFVSPISFWEAQNGISGGGIYYDGSYLYSPLHVSPASCFKINPNTMTTVATWVGDAGDEYVGHTIFDEKYAYQSTNTSPGKVIKIDTSTMQKVSTWTGSSNQNHFYSVAFDRHYIFITADSSSVGVIRKIIGNVNEIGT